MGGPVVGVLALQGGFAEHAAALRRCGAAAVEVRTAGELAGVQGLVIPGGESTAMGLVAARWGLVEPLRAFARSGRPVWGTCAGLIFLANAAGGQKEGGQVLVGGLDVRVDRNFFGAQVESFETALPAHADVQREGEGATFRAIFIRAPAIVEVSAGAGVEVLARYTLTPEERARSGREDVVVGVRQGSLLATSFHPELTDDLRWHQLFVRMVQDARAAAGGGAAEEPFQQSMPLVMPAALPVFGAEGY